MTVLNPQLTLTKSQIDFLKLRNEALYTLFTGGVGSGKSYCCSVAIALDMMECPNAIIGVYAPTIAHVRDIVMRFVVARLEEFGFERDKDFTVNKVESKIIPNHPQLCEVWFKSLDDPDAIIGWEYYKIHIDELDTLPQDKATLAWNNLMARARQTPKGLDKKYMRYNENRGQWEARNTISAYTTPEGFKFTYHTWGKNLPDRPDYNPEYAFVKAKSFDNPKLNESYVEQLKKKYTGPKVKAYLEGEWVNLTSGSVYYAYDRQSHRSTETIRPGEPLFIGCDFNVGKMCASVFVKRLGGLEWHCVAEIDDHLDTPDLIDTIQQRWQSQGHRIVMYPDSTGKNRTATNASQSSIKLLRQAGFEVRARESNPLVKDRISAVNKGFMERRVFINDELCPNRAEFLEQQSYSKNGKPDKDYHGDHGNDSFGYPIAFEMGIRNTLFAVPVKYARKY